MPIAKPSRCGVPSGAMTYRPTSSGSSPPSSANAGRGQRLPAADDAIAVALVEPLGLRARAPCPRGSAAFDAPLEHLHGVGQRSSRRRASCACCRARRRCRMREAGARDEAARGIRMGERRQHAPLGEQRAIGERRRRPRGSWRTRSSGSAAAERRLRELVRGFECADAADGFAVGRDPAHPRTAAFFEELDESQGAES